MPAKIKDDPVLIPLKEYTLEVTRKFFRIYKNKKASLRIRTRNVRAIAPIEPNSIRIYYFDYNDRVDKPDVYSTVEYQLSKHVPPPVELCRKLSQEILRKKATYKRILKRGKPKKDIKSEGVSNLKNCWLYLLSGERVLYVRDNVRINDEKGLLRITNRAIICETDDEISIDISFDQLIYIKSCEKNVIRVYWDLDIPNLDDPIRYFDIVLPKGTKCDDMYQLINEQFIDTESEMSFPDTSDEHSFSDLDKHYSKMSRTRLIEQYQKDEQGFHNYLKKYSKAIFGELEYKSSEIEKRLILVCMLKRFDINLISITDEELDQRIYAKRFFNIGYYYTKNLKMYKSFVRDIKKTHLHAELVSLRQNPWYSDLVKDIPRIEKNSPKVVSPISSFNKFTAEFMRFIDKRVEILYKKWCKKEPLEDFTDEYDDGWIKYILKRIDVTQKHSLLGNVAEDSESLKSAIVERNRNRKILANFVTPKNIPEKDIYNNCWYDKKRKTWFVQNDYLPEIIQNVAQLDKSSSKKMGKKVWEIKQDKVKKFCGFPSIVCKQGDFDQNVRIFTSRKTGQTYRQTLAAKFHYILPILQESDLTAEMEKRQGEMIYDTNVIQYSIIPSGELINVTSRMLKFFNQRFGFVDIPINERVRRFIFSSETSLMFSPEGTLDADILESENTYPNTIYDKHFEEDGNDGMSKQEIRKYCFDVIWDN